MTDLERAEQAETISQIARQAIGDLSLRQAATKAGIHYSTVYNLSRGVRANYPSTISFGRVFGVLPELLEASGYDSPYANLSEEAIRTLAIVAGTRVPKLEALRRSEIDHMRNPNEAALLQSFRAISEANPTLAEKLFDTLQEIERSALAVGGTPTPKSKTGRKPTTGRSKTVAKLRTEPEGSVP